MEIIDWNKKTLDELADHLEDYFKFSSSGISKAANELISFYRKYRVLSDPSNCTAFDDYGKRLSIVKCPQCGKLFELEWDNEGMIYDAELDKYKEATLKISSCPSGGVYTVLINCPHCSYEEEL